MMLRRLAPLLLVLCATLGASAAARADSTEKLSMTFEGRARTYYLYTPDAAAGPHPMLVLLHGSGGNGLFMLQFWKDVAAREGIVLVAPDSLHTDVGWDPRADGPDYIHQLITTVAADHAIDPHRLYLFGQSGGAVYALVLGCMESNYFAAVAIHAGGWRTTSEYQTAVYAKRAIPYSISVGDQDEYFSLDSVRTTRKILSDHGIPVELNILKDRHHSIADVPPDYLDGVWNFLKDKSLSDLPRFTTYRAPSSGSGMSSSGMGR